MLRKIIRIDEEKCNGCGACAAACHEGAIAMVDGKARLMREDYCDGLGDCLPACPMNAISFETREAPGYDHEAVLAAKREREAKAADGAAQSGDAPNALDNTLKSVERIAHAGGFDSFIMFNVYAQRATRPQDMDKTPSRVLLSYSSSTRLLTSVSRA